MSRQILSFLFVCCLIVLCTVSDCPAAMVKAKGIISSRELSKNVGEKLVNFGLLDVARNTGNIFMLVRDAKKNTRDLQWVLYDPIKNKVLNSGNCNFKTENDIIAVSPDNKYAAVYSRYPTELWLLEISSGSWTKIMANPAVGEPGLTIMRRIGAPEFQNSSLEFLNGHILSVVLYDLSKDKKVKDVCTAFIDVHEKKIHKSILYSDLLKSANIAVKNADPGCKRVLLYDVRPIEPDKIAAIVRTETASYLIKMVKGESARILYTAKQCKIVINDTIGDKILFKILSTDKAKNGQLALIGEDGHVEIISQDSFLGLILSNKRYMNASLKEPRLLVEIVDKSGKADYVAGISSSSYIFMDRTVSKLYFINPKEIVWYSLKK